jgi:hypothetical protein
VPAQAIDEINSNESPSGFERRLSRRLGCDGFAEVFAFESGFLFRGAIRDISRTGCYIETKVKLRLECQSEVEVLFRLKSHEYRILAQVKNVRPGKGAGFEFLFQDPLVEVPFRKLLQAFLDEAPPQQA